MLTVNLAERQDIVSIQHSVYTITSNCMLKFGWSRGATGKGIYAFMHDDDAQWRIAQVDVWSAVITSSEENMKGRVGDVEPHKASNPKRSDMNI